MPNIVSIEKQASLLRRLEFHDLQFQFFCWRCLSLCRDTEAMRIAVIVGEKKLGLAVFSMFEF
jgi:hypothetical protein